MNFLGPLFVLTALPVDEFNHVAGSSDFHDCEEGELLVVPALQESMTAGEIFSNQAMVGANSVSGTTLGRIEQMGAELAIQRLHELGEMFGDGDQAVAAALQGLLDSSARLEGLHDSGVRIVRADSEAAQELSPA